MNSRRAVLLFSLAAGILMLSATGRAQARGPQGRGSQAANSKPLTIYVVDTEGGKAALFVSPTGESLLIDSGNPGGRDTDRIMAALADAGCQPIDYLLTTHYHVDHVGGMPGAGQADPDRHVRRSRAVGRRARAGAGFRRRTRSCTARRSTSSSSRATRSRSPASTGASSRPRATCSRRRSLAAASPMPRVPAFTPKDITTDPENAPVGRQRCHARAVPHDRPRRSAVEQRVRADVPEQPDWDRSICISCRITALDRRVRRARPRPAAAGRGDAERHPQGRGHAGDADDAIVAGTRGHLAAALGVRCGRRAEQRRRVHRQRR